jgi:ubiquinol-cytochrome c reductase cytochrome c subunit
MRGSALLLSLLVLAVPQPALAQDGKRLFQEGCSSCHGLAGAGIPGRGPSLRGAGAAAVDFYLSTGRMPIDESDEQPLRSEPAYTPAEVRALVAYVGSLSPEPGEPVPDVHPERGSLSDGSRAFTTYCAGCHQILGRGGVVTGAVAPPLTEATATQIAEAVRVGPHVMPPFGERVIDDRVLDSIVRYVQWAKHPADEGGWSIGHIGPVPEGLVAWLIGLGALVLVARFLGEREQ